MKKDRNRVKINLNASNNKKLYEKVGKIKDKTNKFKSFILFEGLDKDFKEYELQNEPDKNISLELSAFQIITYHDTLTVEGKFVAVKPVFTSRLKGRVIYQYPHGGVVDGIVLSKDVRRLFQADTHAGGSLGPLDLIIGDDKITAVHHKDADFIFVKGIILNT